MLGLCWRRQKCSGLTAMLVLAACAACVTVILLLSRLRETAAELRMQTQRCSDQQEALSVQLQVVYEHRSRLERSLQKERVEHKKTKEDFLLYKLEAQELLNKEKQDAMNRYSALSSQNNILKNQLGEMRNQFLAQQTANGELQLSQRKALEECKHLGALQQTEKLDQIASLQDTVLKLRQESKLLRKAHQDVHSQLLSAQAQVEELQQVRQGLPKAPVLKGLSVMQPHIDMGKHVASEIQELKVTIPTLSSSKQRIPVDSGPVGTRSTNQEDSELTRDKWTGEEGKEHQLESQDRKNDYNQRRDKNFHASNRKPYANHWQDVALNDLKSTVAEDVNEDKDFVDNGDLNIDSQGEEMAPGQVAIAQEPMEDGRIGESDHLLEEEEEEEEEGGNEEDY